MFYLDGEGADQAATPAAPGAEAPTTDNGGASETPAEGAEQSAPAEGGAAQ